MYYTADYISPLGKMLMAADETGLCGLWFYGQKYFPDDRTWAKDEKKVTPMLNETRKWLDLYFAGQKPDLSLPLHPAGTAFQREVWQILLTVPYGETITYGEIARQLAEKRVIRSLSAQAVGGAVGKNPISIIIPCHRVVGAGGSLVGYAGGIDRKIRLLKREGAWRKTFFVP